MDALKVVNLEGKANDRVKSLSGGQKQRLGIACAIAHRPSVLILDEPTVGLDPAQRVEMRNYLRRLGQSTCILVSTHIVDDLMQMAERTAVLHHGRVLFDGEIDALAELGDVTPNTAHQSPVEAGYLALLNGRRG